MARTEPAPKPVRPKYGARGGPWAVEAASLPAELDVAAIRNAEGLTQGAFAKRYGFTEDAVAQWEQGRRKPQRAARILLSLIQHEPKVVRRHLGGSL